MTIDDDDDDADEAAVTNSNNSNKHGGESSQQQQYSEQDLSYLSVLRIKPNKLSKTESAMYETKLKENSMSSGRKSPASDDDMDDENVLSSSQGRPKTRSLNSVVAMLTATRKQGGKGGRNTSPSHQLLDQYKQNKTHNKGNYTNNNNNHNKNKGKTDDVDVIDLVDDNPDNRNISKGTNFTATTTTTRRTTDIVNSDGDRSIDIPGKGQYKIMEQIVTKQGVRNKIILRLGKPTTNNGTIKNQSTAGHTTKATPSQQQGGNTKAPHQQGSTTTTDVNDMYTLGNMVRSHNGLDEMLRNRFNKIHSFCKGLPRNPLQWDRKHVSRFIVNANFAKYSSNFFEQVSSSKVWVKVVFP